VGLAVYPRPASGAVRFAWPAASEKARLEIFDVTGARRRSIEIAAGARDFDWDLADDAGRRIPPGVYLARVAAGGSIVSGKVVLMP
jgi:hypothetical protein